MGSRITIDPNLCHGKPCIRGLPYPVENVLEWLASGMTIEEILDGYEYLTREDILAALSFAAQMAKTKCIQPLSKGQSFTPLFEQEQPLIDDAAKLRVHL